MFVGNDYLAAVASINNLHRDTAVLCGPVSTHHKNNSDWFTKAIEDNYKNYTIPVTDQMLLIDISDEEHNFPHVSGCFFSGRTYNEIGGYAPIASPRGYLRNNKHFIKMMSAKGKVIYSSALSSIYFIPDVEFDIKYVSGYYYDLGYQDGTLLSYKTNKEQLAETWHRFIESPEMFDNASPRWLLSTNEETNYSYAEKLLLLKSILERLALLKSSPLKVVSGPMRLFSRQIQLSGIDTGHPCKSKPEIPVNVLPDKLVPERLAPLKLAPVKS